MRELDTQIIEKTTAELFIKANYALPDDLYKKIENSVSYEQEALPRSILEKLLKNCAAAKELNIPICQDTGMAVVFLEVGREVHLTGKPLEEAVNAGVREAYDLGYMRKSIVRDPFFERVNTDDNTPAVLFTRITEGDRVRITAAPKGFGSENMSAVRMFTPSAKKEDIVGFVVETVKKAGSNPCPPITVGVGLGGDFEYCAYLSKKALIRDTNLRHPDARYAALEKEMCDAVNALGIGPQGFGGKTTCLAVNIETYPTHIAGLPCAVNIGCHVTRHASAEI